MKFARRPVRCVAISVLSAGAIAVLGCGSQADGTTAGAAGHGATGNAGTAAGFGTGGAATTGMDTGGRANAGGGTATANAGSSTSAAGARGMPSSAGGASGGAQTGSGGSAAGGGVSNDGGRNAAGAATAGRTGRGGRAGTAGGAGGNGALGGGGTSGTPNSGGSAGAAEIDVPDGYSLVWHDEFDVDGPPDPKNWKFESGFVRNEEDQWYQTANASVADGLLVIEARKERVTNPNYEAGSSDWKTSRQYAEYTSSSMNTSGLQSFQYGRFVMRAKIPTVSGMWPAWWTLGVKGEWPSNGEIDIMEYYQNKVLANVACGTSTEWQAKWDSASKSLSSLGANWSDDFHVWQMDWDDQNIVLSLDGQSMNTSALSSMLNADGSSPFKQKAYMLVNLALGGQNGGSLDGTSFPQRYEVDYVRVFQKN